jgi:hypothetical protein
MGTQGRITALVAVGIFLLLVGSGLGATISEKKIVLVYCRDDTMPLGYREMMKFSSSLSETLRAGLGDEFEVYACTSMSELQHFLLLPQVVALVSSYVGSNEYNSTLPFGAYFEDGMGMVGFNHLCNTQFGGDLARNVFPIFGNASTRGSMTFVDGEWIRMRTYAKAGQHAVGDGLPDEFTIPDYELNFCLRSDGKHGQGWPLPSEGSYCIVFTTTGRDSPYQGQMLPGVVAYEDEGRSVSFPGFYGSELPGVSSYEKFVNESLFMKLVSNAVVWVSESGLERRDRLAAGFSESLQSLKDRMESEGEEMRAWVNARSARKTVIQVGIIGVGLAAAAVASYLSFIRKKEEVVE